MLPPAAAGGVTDIFVRLALCAALLAAPLGAVEAERNVDASEYYALTDPAAMTRDAPVALLVDISSGQTLYARGADRRFIPASITKVMTLYVAFEMIGAGKLDPQQEFAMSDAAAESWYRTGSSMFLEPGQKVSVDMLLRGIASVSANDGAIVLAEGAGGSVDAWVARMNAEARKLGMENSHFGTPNGWTDNGATFTTARDLERLATAIITRHPAEYARYVGKNGLNFNGIAQANHDPISGRVEGADGIKTGYTAQAGNGFLGSAKRGDTRLVMVLAAVDEMEARDEMARAFIEWGFDGFNRHPLYPANTKVGTVRVQDGAVRSVAVVTGNPVMTTLPAGRTASPKLTLKYDGPVRAPVRKGEQVAELEITTEGLPAATVPLYAAADIERATPFQRIANAFHEWFT